MRDGWGCCCGSCSGDAVCVVAVRLRPGAARGAATAPRQVEAAALRNAVVRCCVGGLVSVLCAVQRAMLL